MLVLGSAAAADGVAAVVEVDARRRHDQHSIHYVRLSYRFSASLLWMLSSLYKMKLTVNILVASPLDY